MRGVACRCGYEASWVGVVVNIMSFGFFSSVFGRNCLEIERDPDADTFEKLKSW